MKSSNLRFFVGGLTNSTTNLDLYEHFSQYGSINEGEVIYDKNSSKNNVN